MLLRVLWILPALGLFHCGPPAQLRMVAKMPDPQRDFFREKILTPFEKKHKVKIELAAYSDASDLPHLLAGQEGNADLITVPLELTHRLVSDNRVAPLEDFVSQRKLLQLKQTYFLMDLGKVDDRYYYLPRQFETSMLVYHKPQVVDALDNWESRREEIETVLRKYNGKGLPNHYELEKNPEKWDYFDLFVVGYYWKAREITSVKHGHIAFQSARNYRTALNLIDKAHQSGASQEEVKLMQGEALVDMLRWQAIMAREGLFLDTGLRERWDENKILQGFATGQVYLSEIIPTHFFLLHGTGHSLVPGMLAAPEELGLSILPQGVSVELNAAGEPVRKGGRGVTTRGSWMGVGKNSPHKEIAFELALHITNTANQIEECSSFGMIPVRQDMLGELGLMFGGGWMSRVFRVASQQMVENRFTTPPLVKDYGDIGENYLKAYDKLVLQSTVVPTREEILKELRR